MKSFLILVGLMAALLKGNAQPLFNTVVTEGPVIMGESFRVQYVLDFIPEEKDFVQPSFTGFRVVTGPQFYEGVTLGPDGPKKMANIIFTLAPLKPGRQVIPGASAKVNGVVTRSRDAFVEVIGRQEAVLRGMIADKQPQLGDYYLKAGEDPYRKIKESLFVRVMVDKRTCYVGQPVVATFKLYSTLESRSDIIKNPGLYGFTVQDMIGLQDGKVSKETINGRKFDVHTIRKVQMYPLRAGTYQIDPMEVRNKVEFYTAARNKAPGQTIREGVVEDDDFRALVNTVVYESNMSTEPVTIQVKPAPELARPDTFSGATGKFSISSRLDKPALHANEEGVLEVIISGSGNFTQLAAPEINWPAGVTAFDPEIRDALDPASAPLQGQRLFRYHFVSSRKGKHVLPAVTLAFFNPDSNRYQTVSAAAIPVTITDSVTQGVLTGGQEKRSGSGFSYGVIAVCTLMAVALFTFWLLYKRVRKSRTPLPQVNEKPALPNVREIMAEAAMQAEVEDGSFYQALRKGIWKFAGSHFGLSGSQLNRQQLRMAMEKKAVPQHLVVQLQEILDHCETGMFTNVYAGTGRKEWLDKTVEVLKEVESHLL